MIRLVRRPDEVVLTVDGTTYGDHVLSSGPAGGLDGVHPVALRQEHFNSGNVAHANVGTRSNDDTLLSDTSQGPNSQLDHLLKTQVVIVKALEAIPSVGSPVRLDPTRPQLAGYCPRSRQTSPGSSRQRDHGLAGGDRAEGMAARTAAPSGRRPTGWQPGGGVPDLQSLSPGQRSIAPRSYPLRIIDLSATIGHSPPDVAPFEWIEMRYSSHADGADQVQAMLGVPPQLLRHGEGRAIEEFTRPGTHSVTHVDAPWHYNGTTRHQPAATIDEMPLEWFLSDGAVLDMTARADGEKIDVQDVEAALATIDHTLRPLDIVLLRTGRDAFYGQPDYVLRGCAVTPEATRWLVRAGSVGHGDRRLGLGRAARSAGLGGDLPAGAGVFWAARQCDGPYSQVERLVNLGLLPASGFKVSCFPPKIRGGIAVPARAVSALID